MLAVPIVVLLESLISVVSVLLEVLEKSITSGVVGERCLFKTVVVVLILVLNFLRNRIYSLFHS